MKNLLLLAIALLNLHTMYAQSSAFIITRLNRSTLMSGAGGVGVALPINDGISYYINPAQLGIQKQTQISTYFMSKSQYWLEPIFDETYTTRNSAVSLQLDLSNTDYHMPISVGLGYYSNRFGYGWLRYDNGITVNPGEYFHGLAFSVGYHTWFDVSIGITSKFCTTEYYDDGKLEEYNFTSWDFGAMFRLPYEGPAIGRLADIDLRSFASFTVGTAFTNFGKDFQINEDWGSDPLDRRSYLGYAINAGVKMQNNGLSMKAIEYYYTVEADANMFRSEMTGKTKYETPYYGIKPIENLILLKPTSFTTVHKGHYFNLFETIYYSTGTQRTGQINSAIRKTEAWVFSTGGVAKALATYTDISLVKNIAEHLVIEYHQVIYNLGDSSEPYTKLGKSTLEGMVLRVTNFPLGF